MQISIIYQNENSGEIRDFIQTEPAKFHADALYPRGNVFVDCDEDAWIVRGEYPPELQFEPIQENILAEGELYPVIAMDSDNNILMLAYTNKEAFTETLNSKLACYYSRSRARFWKKGEESGHTQEILAVKYEKTKKLLLFKVKQNKAACHTGYYSCFYRQRDKGGDKLTFKNKIFNPDEVYKNE